MALVRIQVLVEEEENEALDREARRLRVSRSEVVRRQLRPLVRQEPPAGELFARLAKLAERSERPDDRTDVSVAHDEFIYIERQRR